MKSQTDMMKALGGIPVAMSYGDVYTSLQTGIIDGTEIMKLPLLPVNTVRSARYTPLTSMP